MHFKRFKTDRGRKEMTRIYLREHEKGFSDKCPGNKKDGHHMIIPGFDDKKEKIVCCALCNQSKKEEWMI